MLDGKHFQLGIKSRDETSGDDFIDTPRGYERIDIATYAGT
jgi:hypothetical protein